MRVEERIDGIFYERYPSGDVVGTLVLDACSKYLSAIPGAW